MSDCDVFCKVGLATNKYRVYRKAIRREKYSFCPLLMHDADTKKMGVRDNKNSTIFESQLGGSAPLKKRKGLEEELLNRKWEMLQKNKGDAGKESREEGDDERSFFGTDLLPKI